MLAITRPKMDQGYVGPDLGAVREGLTASVDYGCISVASVFRYWVGFISPMAEFTAKTVQTEELRSSLVYEIRVFCERSQRSVALGNAGDGAPQPHD